MLDKVKLALRITTEAFDAEVQDLIAAALADLGIAGVEYRPKTDPLIIRAVTTYCKVYFGTPDEREADRLKKAYDEQKAQLMSSSDYRDWSVGESGQVGNSYFD